MPMSIANLPDGVGGPGRTQYFNFQYDDSLSDARGRALAADLMNYCDDDLALLSAWFSGRQLDMSPPITVSLVSARKDAAGNPIEALGASWIGLLAWPLQVTIKIDEFPLTSGTPTMLARCLLVAEVSEMYMRAFYAHFAPNPWFRTLEGNNGEGLSRFLSVQFLLRKYPGVTEIPMLMLPSRRRRAFNVTQLWLNSPRDNWLEVNEDDNRPSPVVGCATLFLFYLHDQLGFRIEDIINAGAGHLSNVYENLTHDSALNSWKNFSGLVNSHYPHGGGPITFTPAYNPPLETLFPVSDLKAFSATLEVSWEPALTQPVVVAGVDHPPKLPLPIRIKSSNPGIIPPPSVTIHSSCRKSSGRRTVASKGRPLSTPSVASFYCDSRTTSETSSEPLRLVHVPAPLIVTIFPAL